MRKVWRVARTEYLNLVRSKAFLIGVFLMPVLMGGAIALQALVGDKVDLRDRRVAVLDRTGTLLATLEEAARFRNEHGIRKDGVQAAPRFVVEDAADADVASLSDRVRGGDLFAYVVIDEGVIAGDEGAEISYHTQTPTFRDLPEWIRIVLNGRIRQERFRAAGLDEALVERLGRPAPLRQYGLAKVTSTGEVKKEKVDEFAVFGIPAIAMFLLFALVMMAAPALLNNVLEEKIQRIAEVLVASVSPFELFLGKLLGTVFVSWTLSLLYIGGGLFVAGHYGVLDRVPFPLLGWFLLFQLMALLIFGSIFSAIGAACSELRDAQSMMTPAMLIVMFPIFVWFIVLRSPDSPFAVGASLFPPATPFLMLLRIAIPPGPAAWEIVVAVAATALFTVFCVWAAAKIFRIGILMQGQPPSLRKLLRWVRAASE